MRIWDIYDLLMVYPLFAPESRWVPPNISGWWCNNHLEKYEGQWLVDYPFFMMENKNV